MTRNEFCEKMHLKIKRRGNRVARVFGLPAYEYFIRNGAEIRIEHRSTDADLGAIGQCFWKDQYEFPRIEGQADKAPDRLYAAILRRNRTPLIIDGGANIGASVLWFAARYPAAHIVAIEPALDNCVLLRRNTGHLDVDIRQAGLGLTDGLSVLTDPGHGAWGYRTQAAGSGPRVSMLSLQSILSNKDASEYVPFILKLDIEGGERGLFDGPLNTARQFPIIIIELHDWLFPRERSSESFLRFHINEGRDYTQGAENVFSTDYALLEKLCDDAPRLRGPLEA